MPVEVGLLIVFDIAAHHNERLPHKEEEQPPQHGKSQYKQGEGKHAGTDQVEELPKRRIGHIRRMMGHQGNGSIDGLPDHLRRKDAKQVGERRKTNTQQQTPAITPQVWEEASEMFKHKTQK